MDVLLAEVEAADRFGEARRVGKHRAGGGVIRQIEAVLFDMRVQHVEEGRIVDIAGGDALGETGGDIEHAVARRLTLPSSVMPSAAKRRKSMVLPP